LHDRHSQKENYANFGKPEAVKPTTDAAQPTETETKKEMASAGV
jgi:hypothetical protein